LSDKGIGRKKGRYILTLANGLSSPPIIL
jgi:hypothetical protein